MSQNILINLIPGVLNIAVYNFMTVLGKMTTSIIVFIYRQTCIKRSPLGQRKSDLIKWPLKRGSIHMELSMTEQEKDDLLIQVAA
jgi:hypothetical protein